MPSFHIRQGNTFFVQCHKTISFRKVFVSTAAFEFSTAILHPQKTVVTGVTFSMTASWSSGIKLVEFVHQNANPPQESAPTDKTKNNTYPTSERAEVSAQQPTACERACDESKKIEQFNGIHVLGGRLKPICHSINTRICTLRCPVQDVSSTRCQPR